MLKQTLIITMAFALSMSARADDDTELNKQEQELQSVAKDSNLDATLKEKYGLTDEQIKTLNEKGLSTPQTIMMAALSKESGKPLEDVMKMRLDDKMGWGKIAKELGVKPGMIGQSVAAFHRKNEIKEEKLEAKKERQEKRLERQAKRAEKRQQKLEQRAARAEKGMGKNH